MYLKITQWIDVTTFPHLCCVSAYVFMWRLSLRFYTVTLENSRYFGGLMHSLIFTPFKYLQPRKQQSKTKTGESIPLRCKAEDNYLSRRCTRSLTSLNESEVSMKLQIWKCCDCIAFDKEWVGKDLMFSKQFPSFNLFIPFKVIRSPVFIAFDRNKSCWNNCVMNFCQVLLKTLLMLMLMKWLMIR